MIFKRKADLSGFDTASIVRNAQIIDAAALDFFIAADDRSGAAIYGDETSEPLF